MELISGLIYPLILSLGISTGEVIVEHSKNQSSSINLRQTFKENQAYVQSIQKTEQTKTIAESTKTSNTKTNQDQESNH